ncbi:MAG: hypothetical protein BMS9Abin34_035 [Patescibacteria group bacterium]|nr:MAG: hypothetical protein BMS9Abin34_035 [Patescibacteria group bacterium]
MAQESSTRSRSDHGLGVKVSKLEGSPAAERGRFVQVYEFAPPEGEDFSPDRGRLFAVLDLTVGSADDSSLAGQLVWDTLTGGYFDPSEETAIQALEEAVYAARDKLRHFSENSSLNMLVVALLNSSSDDSAQAGSVAYFARVGNPVLYLRRGSEVRKLLDDEGAVGIGSQILEEDDVLVVGSPVFGKNFTSKSLPQTQFLVKQFEQGAKVPGFAALLLRIASTREKRELEVKKSPARSLRRWRRRISSLTFPSLALLFKRGLHFAKNWRGRFSTALKRKINHGEELVSRRQEVSGPPPDSDAGVRKPSKIRFPIGKRTLSRLIIALAVLLVISVSFTTWKQARRVKRENFDRLLTTAVQNMDEAESLAGLSNEKSKELLDSARADLNRARGLFPRSEEVSPLQSRANDLFNTIEKITPITEENAVFDLELKVEGAWGRALSGSGTTVYVAEQTSGSVFAVKISADSENEGSLPETSELGSGQLKGIRELAAEEGYLYLLGENTVYRLNLSTKKVDEPIKFERYGKVAALDTYFGNIYLLTPGEDQVYKFWNLEGGYSGAIGWIKEAVALEGVVDVGIDGELWLLTAQGQITRLVKGKREPFSISNLSTPFGEPIKIFTRPSLKRLYILDAGNQRVVVLDKDGNFVRQFKGDVLSEPQDLWVSSNEKKLYILAGSRIYRVGL